MRTAVRPDRHWFCHYIDERGTRVTEEFEECLNFSERLAGVRTVEGKWGFIDANGGFVIQAKFERVRSFSEGLAAAKRMDGGWGFVNRHGAFIVPPEFQDASCFSEGLAAVRHDHQWGFIRPTGRFTIPPRFLQAGSFRNGQAPVVQFGESVWSYIDRTGEGVTGTRSPDPHPILSDDCRAVPRP